VIDYHQFLRSRRSVRRFSPAPVPRSIINKIIRTAAFAPSAHNRQPWRFLAIIKSSVKLHLAQAMAVDFRHDLEADHLPEAEIRARLARSHARITSSPVIILLCMDRSEMDKYPDDRRAEAEKVMAIQSTANAGMQMLLAAHAEGLGGVWTCAPLFTPEVLRTALDLDKTWEPQAMFLVGYPSEKSKPRSRKPLQEILRFI
jgi:F420 biosynthesis protein FbiB-like protein